MLLAVPGRHWKHLEATDIPRMSLKGTDSTWEVLKVLNAAERFRRILEVAECL
jgi:hypothetical protein